MNDLIPPIDTPGMCYGLTTQKKQPSDERTGTKCQEVIDYFDGGSVGNGLQITGPLPENGKILLTDSNRNVGAIMRTRRNSATPEVYYEILCPRPYYYSPSGGLSGDGWFSWATVRQVPHTLEYEMTMMDMDTTVYSLHYCGPVMGPCRMRIDLKGEARSYMQQIEGGCWDIVIGPGVDPCLMVCFMVIVNQRSTGSRLRASR
jgi:hypothetical protein